MSLSEGRRSVSAVPLPSRLYARATALPPSLLAVALVAVTWTAATSLGVVRSELLPSPSAVLATFGTDGERLIDATVESLTTALGGYALGFVAAVVVGMAVGRYAAVSRWVSDPIDFFRAIPAVAVIPLLLLLVTDPFMVGLLAVAWGCFFLAVINVASGVRHVPQTLEMAVRTFGGGEVDVLTKVGIPALLPYFLSTLRQNISVALIVIVVADMVIGRSGLGFYILRSQGNALFAQTYAAILVIAVVGYVSYRLLEWGQLRAFPWWSEARQ